MENKTSQLTILIDPRKTQMFLELYAAQDLNASQVRQLIREYIIAHCALHRPRIARVDIAGR